MVNNHFRWDFIGLSTDVKPTADTSSKVTDGSTFYCSDNSKLYVWYKDQWYEKTVSGGGGGGTSYSAGDGIDITNNTISVDTDTIQEKLTASTGIALTNNTISVDTDTIQEKLTAGTGIDITNNTISATGGGSITPVQTTGTSTTDVMSQNAVTSMVYADPATLEKIKIGAGTSSSEGANGIEIGHDAGATGNGSISIGYSSASSALNSTAIGRNVTANGQSSTSIGFSSSTKGEGSVAIGDSAFSGSNNNSAGATAIGKNASASQKGSVAVGSYSHSNVQGQMDIGTTQTGYGYNSTNYRLLSGVYDGQNAHDAVTVGQVNSLIDAINAALSTNIPHIGA